jgi:hypothetical protein
MAKGFMDLCNQLHREDTVASRCPLHAAGIRAINCALPWPTFTGVDAGDVALHAQCSAVEETVDQMHTVVSTSSPAA